MARPSLEAASLDASGFLRLPRALFASLWPEEALFASLFVDPQGQRVGIAPVRTPQPGAFAWNFSGTRPGLYLKSALQAAGLDTSPKPLEVLREGTLLIVDGSADVSPGPWQPFHCRSSASTPMTSLDARGTLVLDRLCVRALEITSDTSVQADFEKSSGLFRLRLDPEGPLALRRLGSHAELSFRGTLSSLGIALPIKRLRYTARIEGNTLTFCIKDPFLPTRAESVP